MGLSASPGFTEESRYSFSPSRLCPLETEQKAGVRNGKPDFSLRNQCCRRGCTSLRNPPFFDGAEGSDTRFVVTNLNKRNARVLYEDVYCRRGQAENHIKSWKTHLAADRTSCTKATANQFRLFLHAGAYWLMWGLRASMPRRSMWRVAQFDTLRLRLVKIAARVVEMKTVIRVHLPTSCPGQEILRFALQRIPRLVT